MSVLVELQQWYKSQCDGDWEHQYGIKIDTLDNPGWMVSIDLIGTGLQGQEFQEVSDLESELDWISCRVEKEKFKGNGGTQKLEKIIEVFLVWAKNVS